MQTPLGEKLAAIDTVDEKSLNAHIKSTFDYVLRAQTFDTMITFAKHMAATEQTGVNLSSVGYDRLNTQKYKEFISTVLRHLGFSGDNALETLTSMSNKNIDKMRNLFAQGTNDDARANFELAKNCFFVEQQQSQKDKKGESFSYNMLLGASVKALIEIESKQRLANVTNLLPNIDDYANYNPNAQSWVGVIKGTVREQIKNNLNSLIDKTTHSVNEHRNTVKNLAEKEFARINNLTNVHNNIG